MRVWLMKSGMQKNGQQKLFKNKMVKKISTKTESLDEALVNKPYRYTSNSF